MHRSPPCILVADDVLGSQHDTVSLLEQRAYTIVTAWTLADACTRLTYQYVDLIIASGRIDGMSGLEFIDSCRGFRPEIAGMVVATLEHQIPEAEAWRRGITLVYRPLHPEAFLMLVAERLASTRPRQRWPRKRVTEYVPLLAGDAAAQLLDVSYGGLRVHLSGESYRLRSRIPIQIPDAQMTVDAELVWSARAADGASCICGLMITGNPNTDHAWRGFVDRTV